MDSSSYFSLQHSWCSDSDLSSISSPETLSPVHSLDSSLSPPSAARMPESRSRPFPGSGPGKVGRAPRVRSKQRASASEKEKLRMRDLTKALHHLRSYLPASMAPTGQSLTKIETLRLTIRYISHLSAQLGLSEEVLFQRRERGDASAPDNIMGYFRRSSAGRLVQSQDQSREPQQAALHAGSYGHYSLGPARDTELLLPPPSCPGAQAASCQVYSEDFCLGLVPLEFWG
ncbi:mesogenin-1-like [Synchiropus splendidus]|uniref:mesogenin-1-like n=1 Tax=Synchiropus splendidus TaxID=270530 RepID=UPI00237DD0A1|nr:mesogenin-1-like [Synchiropus splendidus]